MVKSFLHYIHKEFSGLHEAALLLAVFMFGAQLLALWRDRLLAATFGTGINLDVYYAAFRLPDLIYVSVASFVSVTVLIPFIIKQVEAGEKEAAQRFLNEVLTVFILVMVFISAILYFLMPKILPFLIPGFSGQAQADLVLLSRILLLSPILLGVSNLFGSVTQAYHRFFVYSLSPILYNLGIIFGVVIFYPVFGLPGLVYGVVLGALLHAVIQLPTLIKLKFVPTFTTNLNWPKLRKLILVSLPRTFTMATAQISTFFLVSIASLMSVGSITIFNFANNLQSVPLSVVGVSYAVAAFPTLSKIFSGGEREKFLQQLGAAVRHIIFWSMPATAMFIVLRAQVVRVILGSGRFSWSDTKLVAAALAIFSLSIFAQSLILLFTRAYYAGGRTWRPFVINVLAASATVVLAFFLRFTFDTSLLFRGFLESILRVVGLPGTGMLVLPLAFSVGTILNLFLLWFYFCRDFGSFSHEVYRGAGQSFGAAILGGSVSYICLNFTVGFLDQNTFIGIFFQGLISGLLGLSVTALILKLMNNQELEELWSALTAKFWRLRPVAQSPEEI